MRVVRVNLPRVEVGIMEEILDTICCFKNSFAMRIETIIDLKLECLWFSERIT